MTLLVWTFMTLLMLLVWNLKLWIHGNLFSLRTCKLPHQSVSVANDLETQSSDSRINYLSVSVKGNKGNVVDLFNYLGMDLLNGLAIA